MGGFDTVKITSIYPITSSNTVALAWSTDVGRVSRVQSESSLTGSNWRYSTGELTATKTNTAVVLYVGGLTNQFYRIAQVR